eukprot:m.244163 g.244163  ORF g.244163 m.244163 type:complete len:304 (+) comp16101_c0_seq12:52-963(+)
MDKETPSRKRKIASETKKTIKKGKTEKSSKGLKEKISKKTKAIKKSNKTDKEIPKKRKLKVAPKSKAGKEVSKKPKTTNDKVIKRNTKDIIKKSTDKKASKKASKKTSKKSKKDLKVTGTVVYLGHIPFGFFEKEIKGFFSQFGTVTRVRVSRSKKTAKSRGYAFIEFEDKDVAEIVVETMHNYLLFGRLLHCALVPKEKVHPELFKNATRRMKRIPWAQLDAEKHNRVRDESSVSTLQKRLVKVESKKRKKLEALGTTKIVDATRLVTFVNFQESTTIFPATWPRLVIQRPHKKANTSRMLS